MSSERVGHLCPQAAFAGSNIITGAQQAAWEARFAAAADDDDGPPSVHFDDEDQRRYAEQLRGLGLLQKVLKKLPRVRRSPRPSPKDA